MLVATAGHIDHGKTALIRALTGVETDRLPEERARGISIDLGFAYWRPDSGETIGFIDVPGHRRYLRNMLAGVTGVSFALLVIAADDGAMPQTKEHLQILDLLGIARGAVAITKCDKVAPERIAQVRKEAAKLTAGGSLAEAAMFEVSAQTGAGIAELGEASVGSEKLSYRMSRGPLNTSAFMVGPQSGWRWRRVSCRDAPVCSNDAPAMRPPTKSSSAAVSRPSNTWVIPRGPLRANSVYSFSYRRPSAMRIAL